jgi:hypothetical protein
VHFLPTDPDPQDEAELRLRFGVGATILGFGALVVGVALLVPAEQELHMRALGAALFVGGIVALAKTLAWAREWRWSYDRPSRGLSASETFLIAAVVVIAAGSLYPLVGPWFLLGFLAIPAVAIIKQRRRAR